MDKNRILSDPRFAGIEPFENKIWLSSPTMHGEELEYVREAIETNWVSTVGKNINELEKMTADYLGMKHAGGLTYVCEAGGGADQPGREAGEQSGWTEGVLLGHDLRRFSEPGRL